MCRCHVSQENLFLTKSISESWGFPPVFSLITLSFSSTPPLPEQHRDVRDRGLTVHRERVGNTLRGHLLQQR